MSTITADFSKQIEEWARRTNHTLAEAHRVISLKLFTRIIMATPVDTGEAIGGWIASMGAPVSGPTGRLGADLGALNAAVRALPSQVAYLSNSVDHIVGLEYGTHSYGFSPKAPRGMVRVNVAAFRAIVSESIEELRRTQK